MGCVFGTCKDKDKATTKAAKATTKAAKPTKKAGGGGSQTMKGKVTGTWKGPKPVSTKKAAGGGKFTVPKDWVKRCKQDPKWCNKFIMVSVVHV